MEESVKEPNTGSKPRRLRALAFAGGAFDTIMQMGVVHALLVSRGKAPDHVVGISAGAVNAAALAEVLQAGRGLGSRERLVERVRKLREILDTYLELPRRFVSSALPDAFEINAKRPLKPLELPVHLHKERESRTGASRSKAGLIRLLNDLLSVDINVGAATRMIRRLLALRQAEELPRPAPAGETIVANAVFLWLYVGRYLVPLSEISSRIVVAAWSGPYGGLVRWAQSFITDVLEKSDRMSDLHKWWDNLMPTDAATAGKAIQRPLSHYFGLVLRSGIGGIVLAVLWIVPIYLLSPPQRLVRKYPRAELVPMNWREITSSSGDALGRLADALLNLPRLTVEEFLEKLAGAVGPLLYGVGSWTWGIIGHNWATISGIVLAVLLAIAIERTWSFAAAAGFLCTWILLIAIYQPWPRFAVIGAVVLIAVGVRLARPSFRRRVLEHYEISDALLSADALRDAMVHCFDPNYYGHAETTAIIDAALQKAREVGGLQAATKMTLGDYEDPARREPVIHVAPVAANIEQGDLEILRPDVPVVDALIAATAVVPFFPAQQIDRPSPDDPSQIMKEWFIDGLNVSNEPMQPLFRYLRRDYAEKPEKYEDVETVDIYPVADVPVDEVVRQDGEYSTLVDVGLRAFELKAFRDAAMERRLTRLYTKALQRGKAFQRIPIDDPDENEKERLFVHAELFPIELEKPARVNRRLFRGTDPDDFKRILRETVADGCRATLEAMLPQTFYTRERHAQLVDWTEGLADPDPDDPLFADVSRVRGAKDFPQNVIAAAASAVNVPDGLALKVFVEKDRVELHVTRKQFDELRRIIYPRCMDVVEALVAGDATLPGSDRVRGPGLSEICLNCRLNRPDEGKERRKEDAVDTFDMQRLRVMANRAEWPQWPLENAADAHPSPAASAEPCGDAEEPVPDDTPYRQWLGSRSDRPVVSFLFGGGVFRGVFHMGVMNALSEAGLQPDLVAGSSVGAIVASMIASAFKAESDDERHRRIAALAATFLAIDKLVLTDRLADFVRRFTLRAAEADFSPRDIDRALRQFDSDDPKTFNRRVRKVAAGLERLFYFSPFELFDVIRDARMRHTASVAKALIHDVQELLERGGLGQELLGSESLSLLINRHVVRDAQLKRFASFRDGTNKIFFLATAVDLVDGLETLGAPWNDAHGDVLTEFGLLASSAFPAVFRPRQAWEVFVDTDRGDHKYIDGGTIDNLPLDAVTRFLSEASHANVVNRRAGAGDIPHLLFTASLEVDETVHRVSAEQLEQEATECLALMRRAGRFKYNRKIDAYSSVQRRLRHIHAHNRDDGAAWKPLNMHVLAVKPAWLCGTFGFHPMLGFKRRKQAQSIAHGCASTLAALEGSRRNHEEWFKEWSTRPNVAKKELGVDPKAVPKDGGLIPQKREDGGCWFRIDKTCPFSETATRALNSRQTAAVTPTQMAELHRIYLECGRPETHLPAR